MGADGQIQIFCYEKTKERFGELTDSLIEAIPNSYKHEIFGKKVFHVYHGDNIGTWPWDESVWYFNEKLGITKDQVLEFSNYVNKNCSLETWEVWT